MDYKESNQMSVGPFSLLLSKTGHLCKSRPFSNNYKLMIVPKFVSCYGLLEHFIPYASRLISIKNMAPTVKSEQDALIYSLTSIDLTVYRWWRHFDFHACLTKQNFSSETTEASQ